MKARSRFYLFLFIILAVAVVVGLLTLPFFHAEYIQVEGTDRNNDYILKSIEQLAKGKSIFLVDRKKVKSEIEKDPYIVYKNITYSLPNKVVVHVNQREPKYYVTHLNNYLYLTYDGIVINAQREKLDRSLPEIKGYAINSFSIREKINIQDSYQLGEITSIMEKMSAVGMESRLAEINVADIINITMKTTEGHEIVFGTSENTEKKIEWIYAVLNMIADDNGEKYSIDVSVPENTTYKKISEDLQQ